jgi:anaerobic magnesium-protoporphyrin IX monomethyl ester cyclase
MISVGLIVPTWHYFNDPFKLQPLNELYLATALEDRFQGRVDISVVDLREMRRRGISLVPQSIRSFIPEKSLYLYWIAKSADFPEILSIVGMLREIYPDSLHAAGGTHVEVFPKESQQVFDSVVLGPGEESFAQIIIDIENKSRKPLYKMDWKDAKYCRYSFPKRNYLPENAVVNALLFEKYGGVKGTSALFSRGCNFKCAYCVYNIPGVVQRRRPEQVKTEILYLKREYDVEGVNLRDEICIPSSSKHAIPYLEAIGSTNIVWRGQTRVGASKETLALAKQTGCVELAFGVESVSQEVLDMVNKRQKVEEAKQSISLCRELGIRVKMCLILGLPGEPEDIVDRTLRFISEVHPDYVNVSGFCPLPGSTIFADRAKFGIRNIDSDWNRHAHLMMRFSNEEHFGVPFNYEETTPWGKGFSKTAIINNIKMVQAFLRENGMSY